MPSSWLPPRHAQCRSHSCDALLAALVVLYSALGLARRIPSSWLSPRHTRCRSRSCDAILAALVVRYLALGVATAMLYLALNLLNACHPFGYYYSTHGADLSLVTRCLLRRLCRTSHRTLARRPWPSLHHQVVVEQGQTTVADNLTRLPLSAFTFGNHTTSGCSIIQGPSRTSLELRSWGS
jgi:hypothetical protein